MSLASPFPAASEYVFRCKLCGHRESWTTEVAAQAASVWHVYNEHLDEWKHLAGTRRPVDPHPEELGSKLEPWESQA